MLLNIIKYNLIQHKVINAYSINFGLRHISTRSARYLISDICSKIIIFIDLCAGLSYFGYAFMTAQEHIFASAIEKAIRVVEVVAFTGTMDIVKNDSYLRC